MDKKILLTAAVLGLTAIILGAFGAHALKKVLSEGNAKQLDTIPLKLPESILSND